MHDVCPHRPTDPNTIAAVIAEMKTLGEDESAELLAGLVQQRDEARDEIEEVRGPSFLYAYDLARIRTQCTSEK